MMQPTRRCLWILLAGLPISVLPSLLGPASVTYWLSFLGIFGLALLFDGILCLRASQVHFELHPPRELYVGSAGALEIELGIHEDAPATAIEILVEAPADVKLPSSVTVVVQPGHTSLVPVDITSRRRGEAVIESTWMRWRSPYGLWARGKVVACDHRVPVLPNLRAVRQAAIQFESSESFVGLKKDRYLGDGSEFDELREFTTGNDHRAIDWKASARHHKLLTRRFRSERNHQVIVAFDTGRLMREPLDGLPKIDHAITAGLLLAYVCLKGGDRVGFFGFDERAGTYSEPLSGIGALPRLQLQTAQLRYSTVETNYTLGLTDLAGRLRRRSLIILITDFVDTVTAELMLDNLTHLARRHLIIFASLRDPRLHAIANRAPDTLQSLQLAVLARDQLRDREVVIHRLLRLGVHCVDTTPADLNADLLSRYLNIRKRELI